MMARLIPIGLALALAGCEPWKNDSAALTAKATAPVQGTNCAACHAYPLKDINHDYHLFRAPYQIAVNGAITCLDCHSNSIQAKAETVFDSTFVDTATLEKWHTILRPGADSKTPEGKVIRAMLLTQIDTMAQNHPVKLPNRPGSFPDFQEYVTKLAHMNGKVDVVFNPRVFDTAKFDGDSAVYNPKMETCSAVACHPPGDHRFASPSKGLIALPPTGVQ